MIKKIREFLGLDFYTSKLDQFLAELNREYRKHTPSQHAEASKYERISSLRDKEVADCQKKTIWDKF